MIEAAPERRCHPRFVTAQRVEVKVLDRDDLELLWTTNISKGGLFVSTEAPPPLGVKVQVQLTMWNGDLVLRAQVVHRVTADMARGTALTAGVGLEFTDLNKSTRAELEAYLARDETSAHQAEMLVLEAIELHNRGLEDQARGLLGRAIELDPTNEALSSLSTTWKGK